MKEYASFLDTLTRHFKIRRLKDHVKKERGRVCYLRHDVDRDITRAIKMANLEEEMGIKSTYFMLHTAEYFRDDQFFGMCRDISGMGHEIGIHLNIIPVCIQNRTQPAEEFNRMLSEFRSHGIPLHGTAAHGTSICKRYNVVNYDIFSEISHKDVLEIGNLKLKTISLAENKLYEAYRIPFDYYFSDSGGVWHGSYKQSLSVKEQLSELGEMKNDITIQVLKHPCWKC